MSDKSLEQLEEERMSRYVNNKPQDRKVNTPRFGVITSSVVEEPVVEKKAPVQGGWRDKQQAASPRQEPVVEKKNQHQFKEVGEINRLMHRKVFGWKEQWIYLFGFLI